MKETADYQDIKCDVFHLYHRSGFVFKSLDGTPQRDGKPDIRGQADGLYKNAVCFAGFTFTWQDNISVLVQEIKNMTDDQCREICQMIVCPHVKYAPGHFKITRPEPDRNSIEVYLDNDWYSEKVRIGFNGTVWLPEKPNARIGIQVYQKFIRWGYAMPYGEFSIEDLVKGNIYQFVD